MDDLTNINSKHNDMEEIEEIEAMNVKDMEELEIENDTDNMEDQEQEELELDGENKEEEEMGNEPNNHYIPNNDKESNLVTLDAYNNLSNNDEDILDKVNREAERLSIAGDGKINDKDIFNKYDHLTGDDIREKIKEKKYIEFI